MYPVIMRTESFTLLENSKIFDSLVLLCNSRRINWYSWR